MMLFNFQMHHLFLICFIFRSNIDANLNKLHDTHLNYCMVQIKYSKNTCCSFNLSKFRVNLLIFNFITWN